MCWFDDSFPRLKLYDVAFRIGKIDKGQEADACHLGRGDVADFAAAVIQDFGCCQLDVFDFEGEMHDAFPIGGSRWLGLIVGILIDLKRRPVVRLTGETKVDAGKAGIVFSLFSLCSLERGLCDLCVAG